LEENSKNFSEDQENTMLEQHIQKKVARLVVENFVY
jgi:hypothetical protein